MADTHIPSDDPFATPPGGVPSGAGEVAHAVRLERPWRDGATIGLAVLGALALLQVLAVLFQPLLLALTSVVIATAVAPVAGWLERWIPRVAGVLLVYLAVLLVLAFFVWMIVPPLVTQTQTLADRTPDLLDQAQAWLEERDFPGLGNLDARVDAALERGASVLFATAPTVFGIFIDTLIVTAMSVYFAISGPALMQFVVSLVPPAHRPYARDVIAEAGQTMGGYVRGSLINGAIVATIAYIGLNVIGVDFPLVLALLAFLGELIPVLGPMLAGAPAIAIALTDGPITALVVFGFYFTLQQVGAYLLLPYVMRRQASVPPLLTLFALVAGAAIAGFIGALLAIPLLGGVYVFVLRVLAPAVRAWTGAEPPPWQRDRLEGPPTQ